MKRILLLIIVIVLGFLATTQAQTKLGYYKEAQFGLLYSNFNADMGDDGDDMSISGLGLDARVNYSILGNIIFQDPEKKFFIGDHIGAGIGMGYFKKPDDDFPFMVSFNLEFGVKSTYIINDDLEVGLKFILGAGNWYTDFKNDFSIAQKPAFIPAVRFKNIMGQVGFGSASIGTSGSGGNGSYFMAEGRLMFGEMNDETKSSVFLRIENYSGKYDESPRRDNATVVSFGFALM
jgi:hypothetical protein